MYLPVVPDFCPLKSEIARFSIGFLPNSYFDVKGCIFKIVISFTIG